MNLKCAWWLGPLLQLPSLLLLFGRHLSLRHPRMWTGRRVTVVAYGHMHSVRMQDIRRDSFDYWNLVWPETALKPPPRSFNFKDEGVTWCMGWSGRQVDALRVTAALSPC